MFKTLRDMGAFPEDTDTVDDAYTGQLFRDKKAAMQLDGSWYAGNIEDTDNTVVIAFPGVPDQKAEAGSLVGGISSGFYITKKAWEDPDQERCSSEIRHGTHLPGRRSEILGSNRRCVPGSC